MDFGQIIKRSWQIVKGNRFLWWLGILAGFSGGAGSNFYRFNKFNSTSEIPGSISSSLPSTGGVSSFINSNLGWILFFFLLALIIIVVLIYIINSAKAGLIIAANQIEEGDGTKLKFGSAFKKGSKFAWRLLGLDLLVSLIILCAFIIVFAPAIVLTFPHAARVDDFLSIFMMFWFVIAGAVAVILALYLTLILFLAERSLILDGKRIVESLGVAKDLFWRQKGNTILTWLLGIVLGILFFIAAVVATMIFVAIFGLIGYLLYLLSHATVIVYAIFLGIILIITLFIINGIFNAFLSTFFTLSFRAIKFLGKK